MQSDKRIETADAGEEKQWFRIKEIKRNEQLMRRVLGMAAGSLAAAQIMASDTPICGSVSRIKSALDTLLDEWPIS